MRAILHAEQFMSNTDLNQSVQSGQASKIRALTQQRHQAT